MSVLGSQLEIDLDPDGDMTVVPRHVGNTGTGCYKLHDHTIRDTKKMPNIPASEKVEATYMYAPTPDEPEEEEEEDEEEPPPEEKNGTLPKPKSGSSSGRASNSRTPPQKRPSHPNSHTPHLLDAPVQQQPQPQPQPAQKSETLAPSMSQARSPSQKSANASFGVSSFRQKKTPVILAGKINLPAQ